MNYGRYEIVKEVGKGSMGVVYQARDPHIDRLVAVKVLRADRVTSEDFVRRFLKEARVIGRLSHGSIVSIYDVGEEQGAVYIAMEFLEGVSLSDVIREKRIDLREAVSTGVQLAETLDYAHQKGVVHRDIKPSNIIVQGGQIKITDFGIAHVEDPSATLQTQAGEIIGTPSYMSPEQVLSKPVDGRTDIFSLGIILYEMVTGRRPFGGEGKALMTVLNEVVELTPPEPTGVPAELSRIIMKALQKDPANRFQTGKEVAEALRQCLDTGIASTSRQVSPARAEAAGAAPGKRTLIYTVASGVAVAVVAGGIYFFTSGPSKSSQPPAVIPGAAKSAPPAPVETPGSTVPPPVASPTPKPPAPSVPSPGPVIASPPLDLNTAKAVDSRAAEKPARKKVPEPEAAPVITTLDVKASPPATVYLNGKEAGESPIVLKRPTGVYQVRLSSPGYKDVTRSITLKKNEVFRLTAELKPAE